MSGQTAEEKLIEFRQRLERAHRRMQDAMSELIDNKNYSAAETILLDAEELMLDLIEDAKGYVVRSSD